MQTPQVNQLAMQAQAPMPTYDFSYADNVVASATEGGNFERCPEGSHQAVCVDIVDLGMVETEWKGTKKLVHKIRLVWQVELEDGARQKDGARFEVSRSFTNSLYETSRLRPFLEQWRGKKFTDEELKGFGLKNLLGINCQLQVLHEEWNGKTYANVHSVTPWLKRFGPTIGPENYQRRTKKADTANNAAAAAQAAGQIADDEIPF